MPVNFSKYAILDYETGGLGDNRQPLSIGIVILDARRLTIEDNGTFYSLIRPYEGDDLIHYNLDPLDPKAMAVNKLDMEKLRAAPTPDQVWENVRNFMKYHNPKGDKWSAPIFTGWNAQFDYEITQRMILGNLRNKLTLESKLIPKKDHKGLGEKELARAYKELKLLKEAYGFGGETAFRPFPVIDVATIAFLMFESMREPENMKLDTIKSFLGFPEDGAHNALIDCLFTAEIFARYLKNVIRAVAPDIDYETKGEYILNLEEHFNVKQ
jgi:DNA polymerase III epsilon subunit-like protein